MGTYTPMQRAPVVERRLVERQPVIPRRVASTSGSIDPKSNSPIVASKRSTDPAVGEAEDALEVTAAFHLGRGHDPVAELRQVHMRLQQPSDRVRRRQAVVRHDPQRPAAHEMDPIEVPHERHVGCERAHGQPLRRVPVVVTRVGDAELAVDGHGA